MLPKLMQTECDKYNRLMILSLDAGRRAVHSGFCYPEDVEHWIDVALRESPRLLVLYGVAENGLVEIDKWI